MSDVPQPLPLMNVDEFLVWAEGRPGRYELAGGRVYAMSPQRVRHARAKGALYSALVSALARSRLRCQIFPDGMMVRIDRTTAYEPDALVRCGAPLDGDAIEVPDPVIVVEVLSPSTRNYDAGAKLSGYFAVPSLMHYLMIDPDRRAVVHHRRDGEAIATRIFGTGEIRLDPPGLDIVVQDLFDGSDA